MITTTLLLLITLIQTLAEQTDKNCKNGNKESDNLVVLVIILGTVYLLNYHKVGQNVHEEEEEEYSSDEDESDEEDEESENSEEEMEDESDDDDDGDNGHSEEEDGDEEEEETESEAEPTTRKRRSSRLGSKAMGHAAQE